MGLIILSSAFLLCIWEVVPISTQLLRMLQPLILQLTVYEVFSRLFLIWLTGISRMFFWNKKCYLNYANTKTRYILSYVTCFDRRLPKDFNNLISFAGLQDCHIGFRWTFYSYSNCGILIGVLYSYNFVLLLRNKMGPVALFREREKRRFKMFLVYVATRYICMRLLQCVTFLL